MRYALERGRQSLLSKCPVTAERYRTRGLLINLEPKTGAEANSVEKSFSRPLSPIFDLRLMEAGLGKCLYFS